MDDYSLSTLNTPLRKIRYLSLDSPEQASPVRYPSMSDLPGGDDSIEGSMIQKGYSQTLSSAVLRELNSRANEITANIPRPGSGKRPSSASRKRYSGIHKPLFQGMESIASHYAASRQPHRSVSSSQERHDSLSSATKKRRTLNGPEEIFALDQDDTSPLRRKGAESTVADEDNPLSASITENIPNLSKGLSSGNFNPLHLNHNGSIASPEKHSSNVSISSTNSHDSSPTRSPRISPSKGSMNLNKLLNGTSSFAKPEGPVRIRQTSLQMAGVSLSDSRTSMPSRNRAESNLVKKASTERLPRKTSSDSLCKVPSHRKFDAKAIPSGSKKPELAMGKKPSISNLQKPPGEAYSLGMCKSLPGSHMNIARSNQDTAHGDNSCRHSTATSYLASRESKSTRSLASSSSASHHSEKTQSKRSILQPKSYLNRPSQPASQAKDGRPDASMDWKYNSKPFRTGVTVPQPFSLYNKPTISSSQKSLGSQSGACKSPSTSSLSSSASMRSMDRFQKFKSRYS